MLPEEAIASQQRVGNINIVTEFDLAKNRRFCYHIPEMRSCYESIFTKGHIFFEDASKMMVGEDCSTSLDSLFGESVKRGEVTSIEGESGSGKTRLALKFAFEMATVGNVLFIDSSLSLTRSIVAKIMNDFGVDSNFSVSFEMDFESHPALTILRASRSSDVFDLVNEYSEKNQPDVIIIDGLMPLLQSQFGNEGQGHALLEELAIELKSFSVHRKCTVLVTNATKSGSTTFLGKQYSYLWHRRLQLVNGTDGWITAKLVCSPRIPYQEQSFHLSSVSASNL